MNKKQHTIKMGDEEGDDYVPFLSVAERKRRERAEIENAKHKKKRKDELHGEQEEETMEESLFEINQNMKSDAHYEEKKKKEEEELFLAQLSAKQKALTSAEEKAGRAARYTESLFTGWKPSPRVRAKSNEKHQSVREKLNILVEGEDVPPPCKSFHDMRLPLCIRKVLSKKGVKKPTPIQVQGLPVALSGRDLIGIASTGGGKSLCFCIPLVLMALGEEMKMPIRGSEGPIGILLGPSRELMTQTFEVVQYLTDALHSGGYNKLRALLAIGGMNKREQVQSHRRSGTHMVVATPGRLSDLLQQGDMNLNICRFFCLDEGDRMVSDEGFEQELHRIVGFSKVQRQMLLFSATMPKKIIDFAQASFVRPVTVNIGRAGAANKNIVQEIEFVKAEVKIITLLETLQKTPPPVVIFSDNRRECDEIYEYLLIKGVEAVAIHGNKDQADRNAAVKAFRNGDKDVLVATDVAAKGLDFPDIQHVINFKMPSEVENYVHRIGRTGRKGRKGLATTFVNSGDDPSVLMDLKHLLKEAGQKIPEFLWSKEEEQASQLAQKLLTKDGENENFGCAFCGGLGHRITDCPKLQASIRNQQASGRDVVSGAAYSGNW